MSSKRRPRASIACTECRRKKIRCDTGQPKCRNCINTQSECIYHSVRKPAANGQKRQKLDVSARLARIERMLERVLDDQHPENDYDYEDEDETAELDPVNATEVVASRFHPSPMDDPVQSHGLGSVVLSRRYMEKLGGWVGNADLIAALQHSLEQFSAHISKRTIDKIPMLNMDTSELVIDSTLLDRVRQFLTSNMTHGMQVFLTVEEYEDLIKTDLTTAGPYCGPGVLFNAVLSACLAQHVPVLELLFVGDEPTQPDIQMACISYTVAMNASLNSAVFRPNLAILRGILALLMSPLTTTLPTAAEIFFSRRCVEICADLGLNRKSFYARLSPAECRRHKLLFWQAYCLNRASSLRIGCPPTMTSSHISTDLPDFEPPNSDLCHMRPQVELFKLYDLIYEKLCSVYAERRPLRQLIRDIMACDQKLEEWWNNLEPWMRDAPHFHLDPADCSSVSWAKRHKLINMISSFHYLTICVHRMTALVPTSVQKQLRSMFPHAYHTATNTQFSPGESTDASTPHSESGFEDFAPQELQHRILRLVNSMELCADAGRKLLRLDSCTLDHSAMGIVTTGRIYDLLNTTSALFLKSVLCADSKCREDAALLRRAADMVAERTYTHSELSTCARNLLINSAQVIEFMTKVKDEPDTPTPGAPPGGVPVAPLAQQPVLETNFMTWPDLEAQQGGFEGLVGELFPEFGLPQNSLFMQ